MKDAQGKDTSESAYYLSVNRNKKSVTLDISKPEGQQIARELADKCQVLIENYKVGTLKKYDLGYEKIKATNPFIIYCSVTGFGQDGPCAPRPGYDFIFQGMGGLMSITGERDGQPGAGPQKVGIAITDVLTGMYASVAPLVASPLRLSETPVEYRLAPPTLGRHNEGVLKALLGRSDADLKRLRDAGIL